MGGIVAAVVAIASAVAQSGIGALIAKSLLGAALNFGLSAVSNGLFGKKASAPKQQQLGSSRILTFREPVQSREVIYGEVRKGGSLPFVDVKGSDLYMAVTLAGHEVDNIGDVYFGDEIVPLDESGNALGKYAGKAKINKHLGGPTQQADADLVAAFPDWTEEHKGQGIAHLVLKLTYDQDLYPNGVPTVSAIIRGQKVFDPRTGLTEWNDNAVLNTAHYLKDPLYGLGIEEHELPETNVIAGANASDEIVTIAGEERAVAGSETSFTANYDITTVWQSPPPVPRDGGGYADSQYGGGQDNGFGDDGDNDGGGVWT